MFRQVCTIGPSFFNTTSGMHLRPFEGRHLVFIIIAFSFYDRFKGGGDCVGKVFKAIHLLIRFDFHMLIYLFFVLLMYCIFNL